MVHCRNAVVLVLSNGFSIGCLSATLLNLLLPFEQSTDMQNLSYIPGGVHAVGPAAKVVDTDFEVRPQIKLRSFRIHVEIFLTACMLQSGSAQTALPSIIDPVPSPLAFTDFSVMMASYGCCLAH